MTVDRRAHLLVDRILDRFAVVYGAVPPVDPEPCYWLESDASESFCRVHAIKARGKEFELGPPIRDVDWFERTDAEDAFFEGLSCNAGGGGESDHTEACSVCGRTLVYSLTDSGLRDELEYYRESPMVVVRDEDVYALDRMTSHLWVGMKRASLLGVAVAVNQAYRIVRESREGEAPCLTDEQSTARRGGETQPPHEGTPI